MRTIRSLRDNQGSALALVIIILAVGMILGTVLLQVSLAETNFAQQQENKGQAYYIARSGAVAVAEYMISDPGNAKELLDKSSTANSQIAGGTFTVDVIDDEDNDSIMIVSEGIFNGVTQLAKLRISTTDTGVGGLFQHAIAAKGDIDVQGDDKKITVVGSVATKDGEILLDRADTGEHIVDPEMYFPPIVIPESYTDLGSITNSVTIASNSSSPTYLKASSINIKNNDVKVTGNGIVHLYVEGNVKLDTKASFDVPSDAKLYVYIMGSSVELVGRGSQNNVFIYAPDAHIFWNNAQPHNDLYGGIIGNTVMLRNQITIRHNPHMTNDIELDDSNVGITYTGYVWVED